MRFSVELAVKCPVTELVDYLKAYDDYGFDRVWVPDSPISQWEVWSAATLAATYTRKARIGVGVTSPYHRSPAVMAHAAATLDHLSGGRVDLSIGRGIRPFLERIGANASDAAVEEGIAIIRRLMAGETVSHQGEVFHFQEVSLRLCALQERVAVYVPATSEHWMEVASRVADGVHTYTSNPRLLGIAREWARRSGRDGFQIITTLGYVEPEEVRKWWVGNFNNNANLQRLCGREPGAASYEELAQDLVFTDVEGLAAQVKRLEEAGVDELMVAYRRPEDLPVIAEMVRAVR
ncbi:MAG: LLM class flavin-dependent oxidoreductase [Chloroflexi bacterium]|nr:LLM class flavin-dependent oxidoreductase [Chloroflexota bacterium]